MTKLDYIYSKFEGLEEQVAHCYFLLQERFITNVPLYASLLIESSEMDDAYEKLMRPLAKEHPLLYQAIRANLRMHHDKFADGAGEFAKDKSCAESFRSLARAMKSAAGAFPRDVQSNRVL